MDDKKEDKMRRLTALAAKRVTAWVKDPANKVDPIMLMDVGILIGRLSHYEGKGWLSEAREG